MIADLKPYPVMKDSGLPWLGNVPAHWEVRRGKALFHCVDVRSSTGEEELLTVSSEHGVVPRSSATVTMFKAESYAGYKLCWPGDLVINSLWAWGRGLGVSRHHGIISSAYGVYRLRSSYTEYSAYVHELVRSVPFNWELQVRSKGIWISRLQLTDEAFLGAPFPLPPLPDQTAIVRFLDHVDRRIRRYIRAKQKLITLLEEQKQAIIHRAVTRGLDPNVRLKPSGVEWLGDVPAHWEVARLKGYVANTVDQASERGADEIYLALEHVESWTGRFREAGQDVGFDGNVKRFRAGDVLFGKLRPYLAKATRPDRKGVCVGEFLVLRPRDGDLMSSYLEHLLRSKPIVDAINASTFGAKMPRADWQFVGSMKQSFPPLLEQAAIVRYLNKVTSDIDAAIDCARRQIELLNEYRTRLIADVVTGKLDVREAAARLPNEAEEPEPLAEIDALTDVEDEPTDDLDAAPEEAAVS